MTYEQNYLAHFGIKGQRWGLRKYQNEDGTLTEEGKQRYGYSDAKGIRSPDMGVSKRARSEHQDFGTGKRARKDFNTEKSSLNSGKKSINIKKILGIVGGVTLAAAAGYAAYKYSGKLQALYRKQAKEKANDLFFQNWSDDKARMYLKDEAILGRAKLDRKPGGYYNNTFENNIYRNRMLRDMKDVRNITKRMKTRSAQISKYENMAKNGSRRDAIKNFVKNRGKIAL